MDIYELVGVGVLLSPLVLCVLGLSIYLAVDLGRKALSARDSSPPVEDD